VSVTLERLKNRCDRIESGCVTKLDEVDGS
jgi:hypothetical protein